MLKYFRVINYKSIIDEKIDMTYKEKKAPNGYREIESVPFFEDGKDRDRLIPLLLLFGPNASGKSNLMSSVAVFWHILHSGIKNKFSPNKLNNKFPYTSFEISISRKNSDYTYTIQYDAEKIIKEILLKDNDTLFHIENGLISLQDIAGKGYKLENLNNLLAVECCENKKQIHTFVSKLVLRYPGLNDGITNLYKAMTDNISVYSGNIDPPSVILDKFSKVGVPNKECLDTIINILRELDVNISRAQLIQENKMVPEIIISGIPSIWYKEKDSKLFSQRTDRIISYHKDINGKEVPFEFFQEESAGTQILFSMIGMILYAFKQTEIIFWDEMDRSVHPVILKELIKLFKSKTYNKKGAQFITTLHNPYILEDADLRVSDVGFLNNTLSMGTKLTRIADFDNVRNDGNFRKQYLDGKFSGLPIVSL
mgnify:CR=1 FL=1